MTRVVVGGLDKDSLMQAASVAAELASKAGARLEAVALEAEADEASSALDGVVDHTISFRTDPDLFLSGAVLADALEEAAGEKDGLIVVLGDHPFSREAAARLSLRLGGGCISMCESVEIRPEGGLEVRRAAYGGVAGAVYSVATPAVLVLAPTASAEVGTSRDTEKESRTFAPSEALQKPRKLEERAVLPGVDLAGARVVVSVGRGFGKADDIEIVRGLCALLDAELGCSRPIAEDFKWLPQERLVGLTGASVSPDLYLALGISGQVQHLAGIKGARIVAAVNTDAKSPIVRNADYTVVGDLYKVIPELESALDGRRNGA